MVSIEYASKDRRLIARSDLSPYLQWIWERHFSDVPRVNEVVIDYTYPWKSRLGRIRLLSDSRTCIGINTLLQLPSIPEVVLFITIAHELTHYAHGFGSPLPQKYAFPHAHQVVNKELRQRNLGESLIECESWIGEHWYSFYEQQRSSGWPGIAAPRRRKKTL